MDITKAIQGLDVSNNQGPIIDWDKVVSAGKQFVYIKSTDWSFKYNKISIDSMFLKHKQTTAKTSLKRGGYCFAHPSKSAKDQARALIDACGDMELKPALDLESMDNQAASAVLDFAESFVSEAESYGGRGIIVYVGKPFYEQLLLKAGRKTSILEQRDLWHCQYRQIISDPDICKNWPTWTLFQYRADAFPQYNIPAGRCNGVSTALDLNAFNGDQAMFDAWVESSKVKPIPNTLDTYKPYETATINGLLDSMFTADDVVCSKVDRNCY